MTPDPDQMARILGGLEKADEIMRFHVDRQTETHNALVHEVAVLRSEYQVHVNAPHPTPAHIAWLDREIRRDATSEEMSIEHGFSLRVAVISLCGSFILLILIAPLIEALFRHWGFVP